MQVRPVFENGLVAEEPTAVYGPPLVVAREIEYEVAPEEAVHETLAAVWLDEVAATPVGAAGGVQVPATGVTERQMEGAEAAASLPEGCATTW